MPYSVTILVTIMPNLKLFSWAFHIKIIFRLKNVVLKKLQTFFTTKLILVYQQQLNLDKTLVLAGFVPF